MSGKVFRVDGRCQRCARPTYAFAILGRWRLAYFGGLPPNPAASTCLACLTPYERGHVDETNGDKLVHKLAAMLQGMLSSSGGASDN